MENNYPKRYVDALLSIPKRKYEQLCSPLLKAVDSTEDSSSQSSTGSANKKRRTRTLKQSLLQSPLLKAAEDSTEDSSTQSSKGSTPKIRRTQTFKQSLLSPLLKANSSSGSQSTPTSSSGSLVQKKTGNNTEDNDKCIKMRAGNLHLSPFLKANDSDESLTSNSGKNPKSLVEWGPIDKDNEKIQITPEGLHNVWMPKNTVSPKFDLKNDFDELELDKEPPPKYVSLHDKIPVFNPRSPILKKPTRKINVSPKRYTKQNNIDNLQNQYCSTLVDNNKKNRGGRKPKKSKEDYFKICNSELTASPTIKNKNTLVDRKLSSSQNSLKLYTNEEDISCKDNSQCVVLSTLDVSFSNSSTTHFSTKKDEHDNFMPNNNRFESISRGSMNQNDKSLHTGGGLQCVIMSCSATAMSVAKSRKILSMNDIDTILRDGNELYVSHLNGASPRFLDPEEIPNKFTIGTIDFTVQSPVWQFNGLYPTNKSEKINAIRTLSETLSNIFESNEFDKSRDSIIFTFQNFTVSCWAASDMYFLFNSHAVDQNGTKNLDHNEFNKARLFRVNDINTLARLLLIDGKHDMTNNQYSLHTIRVLSYYIKMKTTNPDIDMSRQNVECISSGTMHQNSNTLLGGGLQCVVMSVTACSLSVIKNRAIFTTNDIDTILRDGDKTYVTYLNGALPRCLEPEEAPTSIIVDDHTITVETPRWFRNGLFPVELTNDFDAVTQLANKLHNAFESLDFDQNTDNIIFTFELYTVSCWLSGNTYYLFNSHPVDETGKNNHNPILGKARLFKITNIQALAKLLLINGHYGRLNNEYSLHILRVSKTTVQNSHIMIPDSESDSMSITESVCTITSICSSSKTGDGKRKRRPKKTVFGKKKTNRQTKYKKEHPEVQAAARTKYLQNNPEIKQKKNLNYKNIQKEKIIAKKHEYNTSIRNVPKNLRKLGLLGELSGDALNKVEQYTLKNVSLLSNTTITCRHCAAKLFHEEQNKTFCCGNGQYNVGNLPLLTEKFYEYPEFLKHSRAYNNAFAFSSIGTSGHFEQLPGPGFIKIQGRTYHRIFDLSYTGTENPLRYFVYDEAERYEKNKDHGIEKDVVTEINHFLHEVNPFIDHFKRLSLEASNNAFLVLQRGSRAKDGANLGSNVTADTEVAALISCDEANIAPRSVVVWKVGQAKPHTIPLFNELYEPLHYALLYPHGTLGWYLNKLDNKGKNLTQLRYYRYHMLTDYRFSEMGRLSEEWLVDMYSRLEEERLNFLKKVQNKLRAAPLNELIEAANEQPHRDVINDETIIGEFGDVLPGRVFLPNTFTGGPRYMQTKYMDGIALVNRLGRPSYFLTFTCNPNWPEIIQSCRSRNSKSPVILARVFKLKLQQLINDLRHGQFFGPSVYIMYMIEFQKRGLPHAHICFRVEGGGPVQNTDIDKFVRADIPSPEEANGRLQKLVLQHMIHGPCGVGHREDIPCWNKQTQKCERYFPKPAAETTHTDTRGFVIYKRNPENKATIKHFSKQYTIDDRWVVPYNAAILLKYDAHINLEIAATRKIIKYIFKYMTKGPDKARVAVVADKNDNNTRVAAVAGAQPDQTTDDSTANPVPPKEIVDETEEYVTQRFLGSCEATWRLLSYEICEREPAITQLTVHLEGKQTVLFKKDQNISTENASSKLIIYFKRPLDPEFDNLTYETFYEQYIVHPSKPKTNVNVFEVTDGKHYVTRRQRGEMVARLYWVTPNRGELFYLRTLLKIYPCRCYADLLALGGPDCTTFQQAARHVGLADDEQEYERALLEASGFCTGRKLRSFFVLLINNGAPAMLLWEKFKDVLSEDFAERESNIERAHYKALIVIDRILRKHGSCAKDQGLPEVFDDTTELGREKELYNPESLKLCEFVEEWLFKMSLEQRAVFDHVNVLLTNNNSLKPDAKTAIFIDGPSGTGKSLLLNLIAAHIRGTLQGVALCSASSGVAAMTLEGGTTIHSMFKMPLELTDDNSSVWNITNTSQRAELIRAASVIIIDEAPMSHKYLFHILDRSLKDLMQCPDRPFGGKIIILAGDFRQIPPVVKSVTCNNDIIKASLRTSPLWPIFHKFTLTQAQRTKTDNSYSEFLLNLGSGLTKPLVFDDDKDKKEFISLENIDTCTDLGELIDFVFPSEILSDSDMCAKRAILTTLNINVKSINALLIDRIPGDLIHLYSVDTVEAEVANEFQLGPDTLNMVQSNGVPDHKLLLKIGCVCLITRNLSFADRLVNGTKVIVVDVTPRIVTVRKPDDTETFLIPRITFKLPVQPGSPVEMSRVAFPLQLCYAMTVHKSQGQTISKVGVDLRSDVFSHGQLYVALGRVRCRDNILVLINKNRIFNEIPYANNVVIRKLIENNS